MATATILPSPKTQFIDANGVPLVGGKVYTYIPSSTTPKSTWQNAAEGILNTNPIILDSNGECLFYGNGQYRIILKDADDNTIWDALTDSTGNIIGPSSSANNNIPLFADTTGRLLKDSGVQFSSIYPPRIASVYRSTAQSIPDSTFTPISFDTAIIDDPTIWNPGSPTRLTVPSNAVWARVSGMVRFVENTNDNCTFHAVTYFNGALFTGAGNQNNFSNSSSALETNNVISAIIPVVAGDYFELAARQTTGGSLDTATNVGNIGYPWFCLEIIK